jgi:hypothetical protein
MRNFNIAEEIRQTKNTSEKAGLVFDLISRVLYTSLQRGLMAAQDSRQG